MKADREARSVAPSTSLRALFLRKKLGAQQLDDDTTINYLGQYICRLCGTRHNSLKSLEGHRQSARHQQKVDSKEENAAAPRKLPIVTVLDVQHPVRDCTGVKIEILMEKNTTTRHAFREVNGVRYFLVDFGEHYENLCVRLPDYEEVVDFDNKYYDSEKVVLYQFFLR